MKKFVAIIAAVFAVILTVVLVKNMAVTAQADTDYLRIHVRANSNSETDQNIKYIVKDEVVRFITPYASQCTDKDKAIKLICTV